MEYVFYFDESFHDRKISIKENGTINTLQENDIDNYIGVFWGCEQKQLRENIGRLQAFESKYRKILTLPDGKEFKSDIITPKNYSYGIHSFNPMTMRFYMDFFSMLDEMKPIIQINAISKMEWGLRVIFKSGKSNFAVNWNAFFYSLTKYFITYKPVDIIKLMYQVEDQESLLDFQRCLVQGLRKISEAEQGITRKEREAPAFFEIAKIIESMELNSVFSRKIDFTYIPNFQGLCNLLNEKNIDKRRIKLMIDKEQRTFEAAEKYSFKKVVQRDSANVIQIRLSDFISGFFGRMIRGLMNDLEASEKQITDSTNIDKSALVDKRLLSIDWFVLDEQQFELYQMIYHVMILNCSYYWTTMTTSYCDEVCCFYSLIRYISSYANYLEFSEISPKMHSERYNSCCIDELESHYRNM